MFDQPDYSQISEVWRNKNQDTKFKVGEIVINQKDGKEYKIKGVNVLDEDEIEYALDGYPWLVWEYLLQKKEEN